MSRPALAVLLAAASLTLAIASIPTDGPMGLAFASAGMSFGMVSIGLTLTGRRR